jgi:hypothetical protein
MNEPIKVRPAQTPPSEAMQFTSENRDAFLAWADRRFGVSGHTFRLDGHGVVQEGFVWLGRTGTDRDTKISLNEWCVSGSFFPHVMNEERFRQHYVRVS